MERILIVFASKTGTTEDVAVKLAQIAGQEAVDLYDCRAKMLLPLEREGERVYCGEIAPDPYGAVALGTPLYMGRPPRAFISYCKRHAAALAGMRPVLFSCGVGTQAENQGYLWKALPEAVTRNAVLYRQAGGEIRWAHMGCLSRMAMRGFVKDHGEPAPLNDEVIRALGRALRAVAMGEVVADA